MCYVDNAMYIVIMYVRICSLFCVKAYPGQKLREQVRSLTLERTKLTDQIKLLQQPKVKIYIVT